MTYPPKNKQRAKPFVANLQHTSLSWRKLPLSEHNPLNKVGVLYHDPSR